MIKVPPSITVRIIKADPEAALPKNLRLPDLPELKPENPYFKRISCAVCGFIISIVFFSLLKIVGINLGNIETSLVLGIPTVLGFVTPYLLY